LYWRARYLRERDPARTLELLDRVLAIDPLEQQAAIQRAATLSATGRGDEARAEYERILQLYPDSVAVLRAYAYDELNWGRLADSHALSRRLDALANFTDPWLHLLPIQIDASLGRTAEARARLVRLTGTAQAEWVRESMLAILDRDYARLVALDRAAAMRDPSARRDLMQSILLVDRASEAVEIARGLAPGLLDDPPQVPDEFECQAAYAALALRRTGDREQAVRVANAAFTKLQALPGLQRPNDVACRAGLLQMAERRDEALAEFTRAVDLGYRGVVLGAPIPLEDDPLIRDWNGDPRVRAQLERIRADLERQRREIELATARGPQTEKAANG
jgi:tetratricopeptide (TPR) repeat protein